MEHILHLENPATEWENTTPIGNGYLGASLFGQVAEETITLNEETIWSDSPHHTGDGAVYRNLSHTRQLLLDGKVTEANRFVQDHASDIFERINAYETAGELKIRLHPDKTAFDRYTRDLHMDEGIASVAYTADGVRYQREAVASHPDHVLAFRLSADRKQALSAVIAYERLGEFAHAAPADGDTAVYRMTQEHCINTDFVRADGNTITAVGKTAFGDHHFCVKIRVFADNGTIRADGVRLAVEHADAVTIFVTIVTQYREKDYEAKACAILSRLSGDYTAVRETAVGDFTSLMGRSDMEVGDRDEDTDRLPVGKRLERVKDGQEDTGLVNLYFAFGKYLLISSGREDTFPANLQGVWNDRFRPAWNSDYHTNINLQMNYWPSEVANLPECHLSLFNYMNRCLLEAGKQSASDCYHCRGTVTHHLSDIYGYTAPADAPCGMWPMGGAWLCFHMWEHYLYTLDRDYLAQTAYEFLRQSVLFFLDYLVEDENGQLLSGPSMSPENQFYLHGHEGATGFLCLSPAMDVEIVGGLFRIFRQASVILGRDEELRKQASDAESRLPELKIGKYGQIMEWMEDYEEPEPGHRHISPLFALYPGHDITPDKTPELFRAAQTTIARRLASGGGHTGWSRAWIINMYARLKDAGHAYEHLQMLFRKSTKDNLFDSHPPFQIDGNFGGAAGIAEMLLQSHDGKIELLPACPFEKGHFTRLVARGGIEVSAEWENHRVTGVTLMSRHDTSVTVLFPDGTQTVTELTAHVPFRMTGVR